MAAYDQACVQGDTDLGLLSRHCFLAETAVKVSEAAVCQPGHDYQDPEDGQGLKRKRERHADGGTPSDNEGKLPNNAYGSQG